MKNLRIHLILLLISAHNYRCISNEEENHQVSDGNCKTQWTRVATQKKLPGGLTTATYFISDTSADYRDIITQPVFVDKSNLILHLFTYTVGMVNVLITYPRKWGKSTNLDMIKFFAEMIISPDGKVMDRTKTEAYNFFKFGKYRLETDSSTTVSSTVGSREITLWHPPLIKNTNTQFSSLKKEEEDNYLYLSEPPLISENQTIIEEHLGKYLTIHLSLILDISDGEKLNYDIFLKSFQKKIKRFFIARPYIKKQLVTLAAEDDEFAAELLKEYHSISDSNTLNDTVRTALKSSLITICQCLEHCHRNQQHRGILILIDEYDYVYNEIFFNPQNDYKSKDAGCIMRFISDLMLFTFKESLKNAQGKKIRVKSIITGISRLSKTSIFTSMSAFSHWSMESVQGSVQPFYGFVTEEVKELANLRGLPSDSLQNLISSYDGYRSFSDFSEPIFNPVSIIKHLNAASNFKNGKKPELGQWISTGSQLSDSLPYVFTHFQIRFKIEPLLNLKNHIRIEKYALDPTTKQMEEIAEMVRNHNSWLSIPEIIDVAIGILVSTGFLSICDLRPDLDNDMLCVKIPNEELGSYFNSEFKKFYKKYQYYELLEETSQVFDKYLNDMEGLNVFENSVVSLFSESGPYTDFMEQLSSVDDRDTFSRSMGFLDRSEASAHFTIFQVLSFLQREKKIMLGSEVSFSYKSALKTDFRYRMDLVCCNENNIMIIEMKANAHIGIETVLQQGKDYLLAFKDGPTKKFVSYKVVAINVNEFDSIDIETETMTHEDVLLYQKEWDILEQEAAKQFEKNKGSLWGSWNDLPVKKKKEWIDKTRQEKSKLVTTTKMDNFLENFPEDSSKMDDFLANFPEDLRRDPCSWNHEEVKSFLYYCESCLKLSLNIDQISGVKFINGVFLCNLNKHSFSTGLVNPESAGDVYAAFNWVRDRYSPEKNTSPAKKVEVRRRTYFTMSVATQFLKDILEYKDDYKDDIRWNEDHTQFTFLHPKNTAKCSKGELTFTYEELDKKFKEYFCDDDLETLKTTGSYSFEIRRKDLLKVLKTKPIINKKKLKNAMRSTINET